MSEKFKLKNEEMNSKHNELNSKIGDIKSRTNDELQKELDEARQALTDRITEIQNLKKELDRRSNEIHKLNTERKELQARLEDIYSSDGWKLLSVYYRLKGKYLQEGSTVLKRLKGLKNSLKINSKQQPTGASAGDVTAQKYYLPEVPVDLQFPVAFPVFNQPLVSILIPVYNNWQFTRNCLISIYQHFNDVSYEIIIGDDLSTDETQQIENYFKNILHLRNKENLGYTLNINNMGKHAKGRFILTLNNDTTVTPNWLSSMIAVMNNDKTVGLVGSKLVYPDGTLQEAGGIIWKDGSGSNYGNRKDPGAPEYNYLKEVDYISGASNLIRKEIWDELKGLDERYAPAYFDDSDLAFSIRNLGYKVMYQPLSVVIHYEGLTHGTSTNSGIKKYQVLNAEKFVEKWKKNLEEDHFSKDQSLFLARDRSRKKRTILVIDHYVPEFDKDAGSRTVFQYLEVLAELGYNVKFLSDNFLKTEPYTTALQQKGIEVLYGQHYYNHWQQWIINNQQYIDFVLLNRPHISTKYIDLLKKKTRARIFYYGHDLHYIRELKEYEVKKDEARKKSAEEWKRTEFALFKKSDVILTPTTGEKEIIRQHFNNKKIEVIPAFFYPEIAPPITNFEERKNLLFVGGFTHRPNVDAVLWFVEKVLPIIRGQHPEIQLIIVGSNMPGSVAELASDNVIIKGFVSDEELDELYNKIQIAIMPLRYGAGLKGKTVEAMAKGLPLVSTSFGLEGIAIESSVLQAKDSEEDFANAILSLYDNTENLEKLSADLVDYANRNFTKKNAAVFFRSLFS